MDNNSKKLYRSKTDRMIGGVCGGLAVYFNIEPPIIRLINALGAVFTGSIIFWV
mgnify:CR=1 FL=1